MLSICLPRSQEVHCAGDALVIWVIVWVRLEWLRMALRCPVVGDGDTTMSLDLTKSIDSDGDPLPEGRVLYIVYVPRKKKLPILR